MAAIVLLRLHDYTGNASYRDQAEQTLETFAEVVGQFGIFAATYGIAVSRFLENPVQVVVISESTVDAEGFDLAASANAAFAFNKTVIRLTANKAVAANLPPALAATLPNLPELKLEKAFAVVCSGFACQPPIKDAEQLRRAVEATVRQRPSN
jgi:hypothetical protein